jgi:hypothetical protein
MKSSLISYTCAVNNGSMALTTMDKETYDLSIEGYMGEEELTYLTKGELIELGEWLIAMGKDKE